MMPFDTLFPDLAAAECRTLRPCNDPDLPDATFLLREYYCAEADCDCRRTLLQIWWTERREIAATINYSFEPAKPPFEDEPQIFVDPMNPQSDASHALCALVGRMLANDPGYRDRLIRHYEMWKAVVDDPSHPGHSRVRTQSHDDPDHRPAYPKMQAPRRGAAKVGPNEPCPCGSGKEYKKCCRAADPSQPAHQNSRESALSRGE